MNRRPRIQQENYQITKPEDYFGNEMDNYWRYND